MSPETGRFNFDTEVMEKMYWSGEEAELVSRLLRGDEINEKTDEDKKKLLWQEVKEVYEIPKTPRPKSKPTDNMVQTDYEESTLKRAKTVLSLLEPALRKYGIWEDDYRRVYVDTTLRPDDKSGFSYLTYRGAGASKKGELISEDDGGPNLRPRIGVPQAELVKGSTEDERIRRSLAHEAIHSLREITNQNFWDEHAKEAEQAELRRSHNKPDKERLIGGYYVGSNKLGSEAVGDLFALITQYTYDHDEEPNLEEIFDLVSEKMTKREQRLASIDQGSDSYRIRYAAANKALEHHLSQMLENGCGDINAIRFAALASYGFTSFEKAPLLIELGIINNEKLTQMENVLRYVNGWLASKEELGYDAP